jgi:hypothetical protein
MVFGQAARGLVTSFGVVVIFASLTLPVISKSPFDAGQHRAPKRRAHSSPVNCLPQGVRRDEVVSYGPKGRTVTVERKLTQIRAQCRNRKLIDPKGREIRFHRPSCWGNPPADYLEIQQSENEELQRLQKRYTVIVFGCNPMIQ